MPHKPYLETVRQLVSGAWGQDFPTDEAAQKNLLANLDLSGACGLAILNRIDTFIDALTNNAMSRRFASLQSNSSRWIQDWLETREEKHGEAPKEVRDWLLRGVHQCIGRDVKYGNIPSGDHFWIELPEKGTASRKAYDNWMRRKIKPANNGE